MWEIPSLCSPTEWARSTTPGIFPASELAFPLPRCSACRMAVPWFLNWLRSSFVSGFSTSWVAMRLVILGLLSPFEVGVIRLSEVDLVLELTLLVFATGMSISIQVQPISNASCSCCVMSGSTWGFLSKIVWCSRRCECPVKICLISLPFLLWLFSCNTRV